MHELLLINISQNKEVSKPHIFILNKLYFIYKYQMYTLYNFWKKHFESRIYRVRGVKSELLKHQVKLGRNEYLGITITNDGQRTLLLLMYHLYLIL